MSFISQIQANVLDESTEQGMTACMKRAQIAQVEPFWDRNKEVWRGVPTLRSQHQEDCCEFELEVSLSYKEKERAQNY